MQFVQLSNGEIINVACIRRLVVTPSGRGEIYWAAGGINTLSVRKEDFDTIKAAIESLRGIL